MNKTISIWCLVILLFLSCFSVFAEQEKTNEEYRMAWVLTYNENIKTAETIRQAVDEARKANLNALLPIAHRRGRAYYASSFLPVYNPTEASIPLDTLKEFVRCAHDTSGGKAYVEIHPWIVLFPVWLEASSPPGGHVLLRHPEWITQKREPEPPASNKVPQKWIDPGVPGVCEYIVDVSKEIVSKYDVDGLNLDYIRYYEGGHGYNPIALERFRKRIGRDKTPDPADPEWQAWQREQITNLLRRIYVETKAIKPELKISVCSIIWGSPDKPFEETPAYTRVMQDWPSWFKEGIADINLPMNYRSEANEQRKKDFRTWTSILDKRSGDRLFVNGLGNYLNSIAGSLEQVKASRENGADGSCLFRFGVNNNEEKPCGALLEALKKDPFQKAAIVPETPWLKKPETGMIRGFVSKGDSSKPVDGIKVALMGQERTVYTDGSGYYAFVGVKPGDCTVGVLKSARKPVAYKKVIIKAGEIVTADLTIPPSQGK